MKTVRVSYRPRDIRNYRFLAQQAAWLSAGYRILPPGWSSEIPQMLQIDTTSVYVRMQTELLARITASICYPPSVVEKILNEPTN